MKAIRVKKLDNIADDITINISGAKNALLHLIFAGLIPASKTVFSNVPTTLLDYKGAKEILESVGAKVVEKGENVAIDTSKITKDTLELCGNQTSKTRCSLMLLGAMLKQKSRVKIGFPGGCSFSEKRPFDIHLEGLEALGAEVVLGDEFIEVIYKEEKNAEYKMPFPSVGATMNLIMYAVIGSSKVILENVALEPEVVTLIDYLNKCGANINFDTNSRKVEVDGVTKLKGCEFEIIYDRIQAMTYATMAYLYKTNVTITNINTGDTNNIKKPLEKLTNAGAKWEYDSDKNLIKFYGKNSSLNGVDIIAAPFPHFPTDLQPIYAIMLLMANSTSTIQDTVYPERLNYVYQIRKMGFDLSIDNNLIRINPIEKLSEIRPATMSVKDLRAGMACLMAGSLLEESSTINNAHQIFRGYNNLVENMSHFMKIEVLSEIE
ncbi:UDP-N-acetylglucosamine 1-carboxyvinyltransferase [Francisella adeliensis]|uniref:UDP-N-acetylglucosamine 1-carboxyvinyltransferase n=1 Tax=Francisella adeliensis TaxID=2007306 RepID=A0A2Z4XX91_9GAMM|nr:UDP-N-acetylglucosamine 1-carboxyvinyltransferase [Francisella adeliensis]AXA33218.1 UDP-N-acetylglucosamine 1-carboxyvinyltransferase [Francisella adeliensis]MBK2085061.1 UDP-N-acetylglucosamine 1-carboxyvinyltransferase [Francisella adeliensis]MBK2096948.1 UDP-N-acetylglucosamine 1-carboxyvinyltransferase [Francisella adeliensis]QIW11446.1 UDP-N-acetylglucosamine 1-carboxyvinyltransferase [Francisella adeliensis]QIW13321.1 UDP-N-acetylglucosamine 1-carboxyvinyltransferase [Francisella ade